MRTSVRLAAEEEEEGRRGAEKRADWQETDGHHHAFIPQPGLTEVDQRDPSPHWKVTGKTLQLGLKGKMLDLNAIAAVVVSVAHTAYGKVNCFLGTTTV